MSVKQFLSVIGAITFLYGIGLLILPDKVGAAHGITSLSNFNILTLRMLGAAFVATGIMYWMTMPARSSYGRRAVLSFTVILDGLLVFIYLFELIQHGGFTTMHWIDWGITLLTAIGAGYFITKEKELKY